MKKLSITMLAFAATALSFGTAHAQSFTFEAENDEPTVVGGVGPTATNYVGVHTQGKSKTTYADGTTEKTTHTCVSMSSPPNSKIFDMHTSCDVNDDNGTFSLIAGCTAMTEDNSEMSCSGFAQGKFGNYEGKTGSVVWYAKDSKSKGVGMWHD